MLRLVVVLVAMAVATPALAQTSNEEDFERYLNASRASTFVENAIQALDQLAEVRPAPAARNDDPHTPDRIYELIFDTAMDLERLRSRACAQGVVSGRTCTERFRPRWLVVPRPGLYTRRQLDRMTVELMSALQDVQLPVCEAAAAANVAPECNQME